MPARAICATTTVCQAPGSTWFQAMTDSQATNALHVARLARSPFATPSLKPQLASTEHARSAVSVDMAIGVTPHLLNRPYIDCRWPK
jgi:hypothetical protein